MSANLLEHLRPPRLGPSPGQLDDRRRELLDGLGELFLREGFAHLTVADLASRMKCSRNTLYDLAPTKDELVLVVLDRLMRSIGRRTRERMVDIEDPAERVEAFMLNSTLEIRRITIKLAEDAAKQPAVSRLFASHYRYHNAVLSGLIDDGIASGQFREVHSRIIAEIIDASLERLWDAELLRETGLEWEDVVRELTRLVRGGLFETDRSVTPRRRSKVV